MVTPLTPTDWKLIYDGETVSLSPSIGNWSFACLSYYWIRNDRVNSAPRWSREQIDAGRRRDRMAKERRYRGEEGAAIVEDHPEKPGVLRRFLRWLRRGSSGPSLK